MNVFFSVADFTLKKLCQFILKRTVAESYVDLDDSFLDDLLVNVCDRKASLHNIRLKLDVINDEFFPSKMMRIESASITELDVHLQSLCSGMNYKLIGNGLVNCVINGLDVVVVVMKKNTELPAGNLDLEDSVTTVTSENASIQTIIDVSGIIRDDDDDEHIQHINYIKDWINALQYRVGITLSIRCVSIKIIMRSRSSSKQSTAIGDGVYPRHLHGNGSIIQLVLLTIIILSLWLPIFYNHYYLNYY